MKLYKKGLNVVKERLLITISTLIFIRIGSFLPVPGIDPIDLAIYIKTTSFIKNIINGFSNENNFVISLFTLNIFPYINSSILVQFIIPFSGSLSQLQREGDLNARRYINRYTRGLTLLWSIIQSCIIAIYLRQVLFFWTSSLLVEIVIWLTTGTMIVLWLSELISDFGLGNGASLLIYINIISSLPNFFQKIILENQTNFTLSSFLAVIILIMVILVGIILLQEGVRIIPLITSSQLNILENNSDLEDNFYLPLKLNQAGVMPIIATTTILVLPNYFLNISHLPIPNLGIISLLLYWTSYFGLIAMFSTFYSTIVLNPKDLSDQLLKSGSVIPGIQIGPQTTYYLKKVIIRLGFIASTILATLATLPNLVAAFFNISSLNGLSTTSLLIISGVLIDITLEIEDIIYSNVYK